MTHTTLTTKIVTLGLLLSSTRALATGPYGYTLMGLAMAAPNRDTPVQTTSKIGRVSSYPYITGDTFRNHADFTFDEMNESFNPQDVQPGNVIFVKTERLGEFFRDMHPQIPCRYILLTHNSDFGIPGAYASMLNDPKLIAWFGQNVEGPAHPTLHALPLGIANRYWHHGDPAVFDHVRGLLGTFKKKILLFMNFDLNSCMQERNHVYQIFKNKSFCTKGKGEAMYYYLCNTAQSKFVLSPRGGGLDCHRTWEAFYMGAIPIVRSSVSDGLYDGLPILIVKDWNDITPELLERKYNEMSTKTYHLERLWADYWLNIIDAYKQQA